MPGGGWWSEANRAAAWQFGARHHRKFAAVNATRSGARGLGRLLVPLTFLGTAAVAGWLAWRAVTTWALPWPWIGAGAAVLAVVVAARFGLLAPAAVLAVLTGAAWLAWWAVTSWSVPWLWLAVVAAVVVAVARFGVAPLAGVAFVAAVGWLLWEAFTAWSALWLWLAVVPGVVVLLLALSRLRLRRERPIGAEPDFDILGGA